MSRDQFMFQWLCDVSHDMSCDWSGDWPHDEACDCAHDLEAQDTKLKISGLPWQGSLWILIPTPSYCCLPLARNWNDANRVTWLIPQPSPHNNWYVPLALFSFFFSWPFTCCSTSCTYNFNNFWVCSHGVRVGIEVISGASCFFLSFSITDLLFLSFFFPLSPTWKV